MACRSSRASLLEVAVLELRCFAWMRFNLQSWVFQAWSEMDLAVSYKGSRGCAGCCDTLPLGRVARERSCRWTVQFDVVQMELKL